VGWYKSQKHQKKHHLLKNYYLCIWKLEKNVMRDEHYWKEIAFGAQERKEGIKSPDSGNNRRAREMEGKSNEISGRE
jgi:hypothetical protein